MRKAFISDVHGNFQALEAVFGDIENREIDEVYCLGDIVGYGAEPSKCLDFLIERNVRCLLGNHDRGVYELAGGGRVSLPFSGHAFPALKWTVSELNDKQLEFLRSLPYNIELDNTILSHGNFINPENFDYVEKHNIENIEEDLKKACGKSVFMGHTHEPFMAKMDGKEGLTICANPIVEGSPVFVNVGSVGQPRDHDNRASYGIFDGKQTEIVRVEYDYKQASQKIRDAGLPWSLSARLALGI